MLFQQSISAQDDKAHNNLIHQLRRSVNRPGGHSERKIGSPAWNANFQHHPESQSDNKYEHWLLAKKEAARERTTTSRFVTSPRTHAQENFLISRTSASERAFAKKEFNPCQFDRDVNTHIISMSSSLRHSRGRESEPEMTLEEHTRYAENLMYRREVQATAGAAGDGGTRDWSRSRSRTMPPKRTMDHSKETTRSQRSSSRQKSSRRQMGSRRQTSSSTTTPRDYDDSGSSTKVAELQQQIHALKTLKRRDIELEAASMAQQMIARELQQSQQTSARRGTFFGTYTEPTTTSDTNTNTRTNTPRTKRTYSSLPSTSTTCSTSSTSSASTSSTVASASASASSTPPSTFAEHKEQQQEEAAAIKALLQQYKAESKRLEDQVNSLAKIVEEQKRTKEASGEGGGGGGDGDGGGDGGEGGGEGEAEAEAGGGGERWWAKKNMSSARKAPRRAPPPRPNQETSQVAADQKIKRTPSSRDHAMKALREMKEMIQ